MLPRQLSLLSVRACIACTNGSHDVVGQDRGVSSFPTRLSFAGDHVGGVVIVRSEDQVRRIAASALIAGMSNHQASRCIALEEPIRRDVGTHLDAVAVYPGLAVPVAIDGSSPRPTGINVAMTKDIACELLRERSPGRMAAHEPHGLTLDLASSSTCHGGYWCW